MMPKNLVPRSFVLVFLFAFLVVVGCEKRGSSGGGKGPDMSAPPPPMAVEKAPGPSMATSDMSSEMSAMKPQATPRPAASGFDHAGYAALLAKYVDGQGRVNYAAWRKTPASMTALEMYLKKLAAAQPKVLGTKGALALWLNAYNAWTIRGVLRHLAGKQKFSVSDKVGGKAFGFFDEAVYEAVGVKMSLNELENGLLRGDWGHGSLKKTPAARLAVLRREHQATWPAGGKPRVDPRLHFALVCASKGCPNLRREPYLPAKLEAQLDEQAKAYVNDASKGASTKGISSIFHWFRKDFTAGGGSVKTFIAKHYRGDASKLAFGKQIKYSWALNQQ